MRDSLHAVSAATGTGIFWWREHTACWALIHRPGTPPRQAAPAPILGATMSDLIEPNSARHDYFVIENLKLAAWLRLNRQRLLRRDLQVDGKVAYCFAASPDMYPLIVQWETKSDHELALSRFASLVSFEIRKALKLRRAHGVRGRLTSLDVDSDE